MGKKGMASSLPTEVKLTYATNPFAPLPVLEVLAWDDDWMIRKKVASHPSITSSISHILARDPFPEVRMELAANPNLPDGIARLLARDSELLVRVSLAKNPRLSPDIAKDMTKDLSPAVREALASRTPMPPWLAQILSQDPSFSVRIRLMRNPAAPPEILVKNLNSFPLTQALEILELIKPLPYLTQKALLEHGSPLILSYLARSAWIDKDIWEALAQHPDPTVREMARRNEVYSEEAGIAPSQDRNHGGE